MSTDGLPTGHAVLFVAHPGHELSLHGWLERCRPRVFVLTDGSGGHGMSRLTSTARLIARCGAQAGSVFGRLRDRDIYRAILEQDIAPALDVVRALVEALIASDDTYLVADPCEFYNPSHDLCRAIANLAASRAAERSRRPVRSFDYVLTGERRRSGAAITVELDDEALDRKLQAAEAYTELRAEVEAAVARYGRDGLRREHLYPIAATGGMDPPEGVPFYETFGEARVASGEYATVLRYRSHFAPFVTALARASGLRDVQAFPTPRTA